MLKIIKERTPETIIDYTIEFEYKDDPTSGFVFPANSDGTPALDKMPPEAKANYEKCLTDDRLTEAEFKVRKHTYMNPAVGECICGREVVLDADYMGAVQCECGRWYNLFGQELRDPEYWERDDDD
jgi:hypothetical protein